MSLPKQGVILLAISLLLFALSALAVNSVETSGDPLFYYALNSFFVSLTVFAFPSCFFICKNIFSDKIPSSGFFLSPAKPSAILLSSVLGICILLLSTVVSNLIFTQNTYSLRPHPSLAAILTICIIPAFAEEVFFRGVLLSCFSLIGKNVSVFLTAFIFALMHIQAASFLTVFLLGILLCELAFLSHSLLVCTAFHMSYNFAWLIVPPHISFPPVWLCAAAVFICLVCIFLFFRINALFCGKEHQKLFIY